MKQTFKRYIPYLQNYKFYFFLVFIGILLTVAATTATAQIMQPLMDDMFIKRDASMITLIPLMLIGIYFFKALGRYLQSVFTTYIGSHVVTILREELLQKMLYLDMTFLYKNRSGDMISRITLDVARIQYFVSNMLPELIRESLTVIALIAYVIYLNATLAFYALVVMPLVFYPLIKIAKRLKKLSNRSQNKNADVLTRLTEVFNNVEIIKTHATEEYEVDRFVGENRELFRINMKSTYVSELVSPLMELVGALGLATVIYMGASEVYENRMSVGEFTAFLTAVGLVFQPIRRIGSIYGKIQDALVASERVFKILDTTSLVTDGSNELKENIELIEFKNSEISFEDVKALKNINIAMKKGDTIALVGDSGGGKSTLINLLIRFYDVDSGSLLINSKNIKTYTEHSLRDKIAVVSQRVYIFQDTLAENVAYGHEVNETKVLEALKLADALEFVQSLEDGIHTQMQEFGVNLSGGQRQRIAIARAIYKHASLLILDEATSALDNKSEKRIQEALNAYTKDKITIIIAHRLSTIEHATEILVFKDGEIVSTGTHTELLENSQEYKRLAGKME
ncbi:MAG: ATP-binding cassette domain-containing protein [Helicobacteraceae bacterium]|nr:ATP-binding cassette domain-containing protein [Helicobacteraceae bacterium]